MSRRAQVESPPGPPDLHLERRVEEAFQTLQAIQTGGVDALVVAGPGGDQLLVLHGADEPYRLVVDQMGEGVVVLDARGIVLYVNPAFSRMTGLPAALIAGKPVGAVLDTVSATRVAAELPGLLHHPAQVDVELVRPDGATVPAHLSSRPVCAGSFAGAIVVATDVGALREADRRFRQAMDMMPDPVLLIRPVAGGAEEIVEFEIDYGNPAWEALGAASADHIAGGRLFELLPSARSLLQPLVDTLRTGLSAAIYGVALDTAPSPSPPESRHFDVRLARREGGLIVGLRDITERRRAEAVRAMQFSITRTLSDSVSMEEAAPRILEALGTVLGSHAGAIWMIEPGDVELASRYSWHAPGVDVAQFEAARERLVVGSETAPPVASIFIVADDRVIGVVELFPAATREYDRDLPDVMNDLGRQIGQFIQRRRAEAALREHATRLAAIASTDALTGLNSRREFERLLVPVPRERFAILVLDVDNLKDVNDEHGHEGGDVVLQAVAMTLSSLVRGRDVVARIGGDEFAVILNGVTAEEAAATAERLRLAIHSISVPHGIVRVSIGWVAAPAGADPHAVRNAADEALYKAKRGGRDRIEAGDVQAGQITGSPRLREAELVSQVLVDHAMGVAYQPIVELAGGATVGFEALARPAGYGGTASVESLFKSARGLGRIRDLDWLCRRVAIETAASLPPGIALFLNVSSAALLDPTHGVDQLLMLLEWGGRLPGDTVLEITEQEVIRDLVRLRTVVAAYRAQGVRFAIDDVGEGYSTLELLAAANPEFVKIGASLTTSADRSGPRSAIEAAIAFARSNGGAVIAEGIEDEATARTMAGLGITLGQGFWLGRPVVAEGPFYAGGASVTTRA